MPRFSPYTDYTDSFDFFKNERLIINDLKKHKKDHMHIYFIYIFKHESFTKKTKFGNIFILQ